MQGVFQAPRISISSKLSKFYSKISGKWLDSACTGSYRRTPCVACGRGGVCFGWAFWGLLGISAMKWVRTSLCSQPLRDIKGETNEVLIKGHRWGQKGSTGRALVFYKVHSVCVCLCVCLCVCIHMCVCVFLSWCFHLLQLL